MLFWGRSCLFPGSTIRGLRTTRTKGTRGFLSPTYRLCDAGAADLLSCTYVAYRVRCSFNVFWLFCLNNVYLAAIYVKTRASPW